MVSTNEPTVTQRSVTFINYNTPASITAKEIDLDSCCNEDEIVVNVKAAALNPIDFMLHGLCFPYVNPNNLKTYSRDYAGIVVRKGANVDPKWQLGDHVNGMFAHIYGDQGSLSDYLIINPLKQPSIAHIDDTESFEKAAAWPLVFGTAYAVLFHNKQKWNKNSKILVIGASTSVSNCLVQIAKNHLKIGTVVGVCNKNSIARNKKFGYDYLVPYDDEQGNNVTVANVQKLIKEHLNGEKFDLIFDSVGNNQFFQIMDSVLKPINTDSFYTTIVGDKKANYKNPSVLSFVPYKIPFRAFNPLRKFNYSFAFVKSEFSFMELGSLMIKKGTFKPQIDSVFSFKDFNEAIDRAKSNKAKGKVIIKID
ncbi:hypothetical protein KAFR_0I00120 [Kazachstania africana CBS 2517]|uniref:Enoyl reductase (ER) domain-containing protein n=1 Tax=Kazachstania africana (strain ATCC 22294 / BCRC 22015 / CBS 2517 / CECT 1963 / NBRC 1671 / NRRL Y-8276) TaxID=1071382 RepID=H2AZJ3_KAZAF|nr:hypothetical protein KAFR_0I00120 [Kazachstania africana CBS 2517]CCF59793.1 hypothetical protein KAFR_0I00120 [Kazachstania africana CBS 2517]